MDLRLEHFERYGVMPSYSVVDVRCPLVLRACLYLRILAIDVDAYRVKPPSHDDSLAHVPRLTTLTIERHDSIYDHDSKRATVGQLFDYRAMLDSLPHLTSLRYPGCDFYLRISDLLDIACHSTLEELQINACLEAHRGWVGETSLCPSTCELTRRQWTSRIEHICREVTWRRRTARRWRQPSPAQRAAP